MFMTLSYHLGFAAAEWLTRELKIDIGVNQAILDAMKPDESVRSLPNVNPRAHRIPTTG
jgi:hypothetical protein